MKHIQISGRQIVLLVSVFSAVILMIVFGIRTNAPPSWTERTDNPFLQYDISVLNPIIGGAEGNNLDAIDALRTCPTLIRKLRYGDKNEWDACYQEIDRLMDQFYTYGYLPREPYPGLGDYVTSMDAPLLAVTAEFAYERSNDVRFRQYIEDILPYLTASTQENGYVLKINNEEWWPLEYAWTSVTEEDAWFVLNGSLFGMVGIEMLYQLTGSPDLKELSEKAFTAYQERAELFFYPDQNWSYYSLNYLDGQPIINRYEKLLIEITSFDSLYQFTGKDFYREQAQLRRDLITKMIPIYLVDDGTSCTAYALRAAAPHPYEVDIYETYAEFLNEHGDIVATAEVTSRQVDGAVLVAEVPADAVSYRLYSKINLISPFLLTEGTLKKIPQKELDAQLAAAVDQGSWIFSGDCNSFEDQTVTFAPAQSEEPKAILLYTFEEPMIFSNSAETYFAVEIENLTNETYPVSMALIASDGANIGRTGVLCYPGKNLMLYHYTGFKGINSKISSAEKWQIQLVTNQMSTDTGKVKIGNVYIFSNTAQCVEYLRDHSYRDYWVETEETASLQ